MTTCRGMIQFIPKAVSDVRFALTRQAIQSGLAAELALEPEQVDGWCELAEAISYHQLLQAGLPREDLHSNQVAELGGAYRHAFLVVGHPQESYLVDPTFAQFSQKLPGAALRQTPAGREFLELLLEQGHAPWNRLNASLYGQAMGIFGDVYMKALESQRPLHYERVIFESLLP